MLNNVSVRRRRRRRQRRRRKKKNSSVIEFFRCDISIPTLIVVMAVL